jgi:hypothetical protein
MRHIRTIAPESRTTVLLASFEQFVWRLAPGVCVLLLVLATIWLNTDFIPEFDVMQALFEDPESTFLQDLFYLS